MNEPLEIQPTRANRLLWRALPVMVAIFAILFLLRPVRRGVETARCEQCKINLRAIGLAMQSYREKYGSLPPAYIADESGRPIHSWRVLLLPFLGQQAAYDEYRFDEPWDGPHNSALTDKNNPFFCPSASWQGIHETNYVAVIGPRTPMPGIESRKQGKLQRDPSSIVLLVEVYKSGIHWREPRDLKFDEMCFGINDPSGKGISSAHSGYKGEWSKAVHLAHFLITDGTVREMPETTPPREIHKLLLIESEQPASVP